MNDHTVSTIIAASPNEVAAGLVRHGQIRLGGLLPMKSGETRVTLYLPPEKAPVTQDAPPRVASKPGWKARAEGHGLDTGPAKKID